MAKINSDANFWYKSLTLSERLKSLKKKTQKIMNDLDDNFQQRKIQDWKSKASFTDNDKFIQRLKAESITEQTFIYLLNESAESLEARFPNYINWLLELDRCFLEFSSYGSNKTTENHTKNTDSINLLNVIKPLILEKTQRFDEGLKSLAKSGKYLPFDINEIRGNFYENQPEVLLNMLSRSLILELHVCRLKEILKGQDSSERFRDFTKRLSQREVAVSFFKEYPVLLRQIVINLENWINFRLDFLHHLCNDWEAIKSLFLQNDDPGKLVKIRNNNSDRHCAGRSVLIAQFSSGFQIVYKPRSLAVDSHFQELLSWLNSRSSYFSFPILKILDRSQYGWVDFVENDGCDSMEKVQRFYERQGGYIALLYALKATDFHSENIIASGEYPVLVDLESLFHPCIDRADISQSDLVAANCIASSVLNSGLLPQRFSDDKQSEKIEISGLGGQEEQLTPNKIPYWDNEGTDEMSLQREYMVMPGDNNRPKLKCRDVDILDYSDSIILGFENIYQVLLENQDDLLSENGPLAKFREDEVRVILRPTQIYARLLDESFHPDLLRDALDRDCFFDKLWLDVENIPSLSKVITHERRDLNTGDIPKFTTQPNSRHLWSSSNEKIPDFLHEPTLNLVYRSIKSLNEKDKEKQIWFIRASLTTLLSRNQVHRKATYHINKPNKVISYTQLLEAACQIGERLKYLSLPSEEEVTWLGIDYNDNDDHPHLSQLALDLYDGLPGVALFLSYLGKVTQNEEYTQLSQTTLTTIKRLIETQKSSVLDMGGFSGWGWFNLYLKPSRNIVERSQLTE